MIIQQQNRIVTQYVPDLIGIPVTAAYGSLGITGFYDYGHYNEVCKQLTVKDQGITESVRTKYPLTWLVMDFGEDFGKNTDLYCSINCQLIIASNTDANYTMQERRDNVFIPILYQIYAEILRQFSVSRMFAMQPVQTIQHTKIDRPYWDGTDTGQSTGKANLFNDFIDAIQIKNLKLQIKKIC